MSFRFIGAPTICEPLEFGHRAFPIYTTLRDGLFSALGCLAVGAVVYFVYSPFMGLLVAAGTLAVGLFVSQQLRKVWGNAWPWELWIRTVWRMMGNPDAKGYLGGRRRVHAVSSLDANSPFRAGKSESIRAVTHHDCIISPFARYRPGTASVSRVSRSMEIRRADRSDDV